MQQFVTWLAAGVTLLPALFGETGCLTVAGAGMAAVVAGSSGCSDLVSSHVDMLNVVQAGAVGVMDRMVGDETAQAQYQVSGLAQNPGVTVEAAIVYRARAFFDGVAGQFQAGAIGRLGAADQLGEAMKIARSNDLSDDQKMLLLRQIFTPPPDEATKPDEVVLDLGPDDAEPAPE